MKKITIENSEQCVYRTIVDVLNHEFGCTFEGYRKGAWKPRKDGYVVMFPKLILATDPMPDKEGWVNILIDGGSKIESVYYGIDLARAERAAKTIDPNMHVIFGKLRGDSYRFYGVYKCAVEIHGGMRSKRTYTRIAKECDVETLR